MKQRRPAAVSPDGFRSEFIDFARGIRVGHLTPAERITQILKLSLEAKHQQVFVTDRWGRGVYWQWICFLPKANRLAKPLSSDVNFGCSKFFVEIDREEALFKSGMQVERGFLISEQYPRCTLQDDWDWRRLIDGLRSRSPLSRELRRLIQAEDFRMQGGDWREPIRARPDHLPSINEIRRGLLSAPADQWAGFQLYYPMTAGEVGACTGRDLIEAVLAVFDEVTPMMNMCMSVAI